MKGLAAKGLAHGWRDYNVCLLTELILSMPDPASVKVLCIHRVFNLCMYIHEICDLYTICHVIIMGAILELHA